MRTELIHVVLIIFLTFFLGFGAATIYEKPTLQDGQNGLSHSEKKSITSSIYHAPPIITNLKDPSTAWIRLEFSLVFGDAANDKEIPILIEKITDDTLKYARTLKLVDLEGATRVSHLREDLLDRANTRSNGQVRDIIIRTLVVQ
jgi:flagellar protein FliL